MHACVCTCGRVVQSAAYKSKDLEEMSWNLSSAMTCDLQVPALPVFSAANGDNATI